MNRLNWLNCDIKTATSTCFPPSFNIDHFKCVYGKNACAQIYFNASTIPTMTIGSSLLLPDPTAQGDDPNNMLFLDNNGTTEKQTVWIVLALGAALLILIVSNLVCCM